MDRIERFDWFSELRIEADCDARGTEPGDENYCAGEAVTTEPQACGAGYYQAAFDLCCPTGAVAGSGSCVGPG